MKDKQSISEWYSQRALRPMAGLICFALIFCMVAGYYWIKNENARDNAKISEYVESIAILINQKNRLMLESILSLAKSSLDADATAICQDGKVILGNGSDNTFCSAEASWWSQTSVVGIPGFSDYSFAVRRSVFAPYKALSAIVLGALSFIGILLFLIFNLKRRLFEDLIRPLQVGFSDTAPLAIIELDQIRSTQKVAMKAKAHKEMFELLNRSVGVISHSLSSPLSFLSVSTFTWKPYLPKPELQAFENAVNKMSSIVEALTEFRRRKHAGDSPDTQLQQLKLALEHKDAPPFAIGEVVQKVVLEKQREFSNSQIGFADLSLGQAFVAGDENSFQTVLSDIINNAVESYPDHTGPVKIRLALLNGTGAELQIEDQGCGISTELLNQVTEYGFSKGKECGTGIGLFNADQEVRKMRGQLEIRSKPQEGTSVNIRLPVTKILHRRKADSGALRHSLLNA